MAEISQKKKISILIPCYNEQDNVIPIAMAIEEELKKNCGQYDYEICFIDNCSTDTTRVKLRQLCEGNKKIKAIFNARNFGPFNSEYYGMMQLTGDCVIRLCCDFQDPINMIPKFIHEWENGAKIVVTQKTSDAENKIMRLFRTFYYKLIRKMSSVEQIDHFTGFGLYDKSFIKVMRDLKDPIPFLRGVVAELGFKIVSLTYHHEKRRSGKSSFNFYRLFDAAMLSFTAYTKTGLRFATFIGLFTSILSFGVAVFYFIRKLIYWDTMPMGIAPLVIGVFFLGSLQLFFIGFLGEYIMSINQRVMNRPLVVEEERLNWEYYDEN